MSGIYGILIAATILGKLKYEITVVYILLFIISSILWGSRYLIKANRWIILGIVSIIAVGTIWVEREFLWDLWEKINQDKNALAHITRKQESIFTLYFMTYGALALYEATFHFRGVWIRLLGILCVIGAQIYLKRDVPMYEIAFFLFYQCTAVCIGVPYQKKNREQSHSFGIKNDLFGSKILILQGMVCILFFISALLAQSSYQEILFAVPVHVEKTVFRILPDFFESKPEEGTINRGNLQEKERERLKVTLSEVPGDIFYLKGFIGEEYTGSGWKEANDYAFYASQVGGSNASESQINKIAQYYENYTFEEWKQILDRWDNQTFRITVDEIDGDGEYRPYISKKITKKRDGYMYDMYSPYFAQKLMLYADAGSWEESGKSGNYWVYAKDVYTRLPETGLTGLRQICELYPAQTREEITQQIQTILWENISYTLNPGEIPPGKDVAEYVLFERKQGYCQHYATIATLMYRLYGIPARYVSGFLVLPDNFVQQEDGTWSAILKENQSHAWVEIYIDYIGWIPIETTPPGSVVGELSESLGSENMEERTEAVETESQEEATEPQTEAGTIQNEVEDTTTEVQLENNSSSGNGIMDASFQKYFGISVIIIVSLGGGIAFLICAGHGISCYRRWRIEKNSQSTASRLLQRILKMIWLMGKMKEYKGNEDTFSYVVSELIPDVTQEEVFTLVGLAMQENFGKSSVQKEQLRQAYKTYQKIAEYVYRTIGPWKRIYFKYIKVYN